MTINLHSLLFASPSRGAFAQCLSAFISIGAPLQAAVVFDMNLGWSGATSNQAGNNPSGVTFSTAATAASGLAIAEGLDDGTNDVLLGEISWSDGAFSGVVHVAFDLKATGISSAVLNTNPIRRGGRGSVGIRSNSGTNSLLGVDEGTLTIDNVVITKVSGDDFTFDGFSGIYLGNGDPGDTATTNGVATNTIPNGGWTDVANFNSVAGLPSSLEVAATAGEFSINGVQIQVTGIPEPSSSLLAGLGAFGLLLCRRR